ncbi:MAG: flavoprotein [Bacteroidetes bacterium]|nr:flavoprotein [Bacteroidota bacterium]
MLKDTDANTESKHILLCLSGSISAYKAAALASALVKEGHEVQCVATESAVQFIGPAALEGITRKPLKREMFANSSEIEHIELARWADLILLYPASAATIARLRMGLAEDLVSAIFLANNFQAPYWIAPAMNSNMLENPATQENLNILSGWGARIIETEAGILACGEIGTGRLVEPETIHVMIGEHFQKL